MIEKVKKYEDLTFGQWKALATKCGGLKNALGIIRDELEVQIIEKFLKLFDKNGRRIPPKDLHKNVYDPEESFYLIQPSLKTMADYACRLVRFQEAFREGPVISAAGFERRSNVLIAEIKEDKNLCNLLNGVYLPIIIPPLENFTDYGKTLEETFLPAVKYAYEKQFPERELNNLLKNNLAGKVSIVSGSRYEKLIEKMKQGYTVVIYFPNPLQGFSTLASREQMVTLPESLVLSGGFDASVAAAMYPDVLMRDFNTPGYDLSALSWQFLDNELHSRLYFKAHDNELDFYGDDCSCASSDYSSGLLFLGSFFSLFSSI